MSLVEYGLADKIATLTLSDPATLNAATPDMAAALREALARAAGEARAVILTGAGRAFCSGANLAAGASAAGSDGLDVGQFLESHFNPMMLALRDLDIPFVTAVNGAAAGIGCSIALMGDLIVAGESAYFLQAFRRVGLVPDGGATWLLPRMVGRARAMEMMLLGEKTPARTALEWGMINRCVPDEALADTARALATSLAEGPKALSMIRKLAWAGLEAHFAEQLQHERLAQRDAGRTADCLEGVSAFLQKRAPSFSGT